MDKFIKVGNSEELIPVKDIYAFIYESEKGKTVLRITFDKATKTFQEIVDLLEGKDVAIEEHHMEDVTTMKEDESTTVEQVCKLSNVYTNFCKDFKCNYNATDGTYFVELTKKTDTEILTEANQQDTLAAYMAIAELYENS